MKKNIILGFDVSSNSCSIAISRGQEILSFAEEHRPNMQAECLVALIEQVLFKAGLEYTQLDYIAPTVGPGSFTGIRIGLAAAKAITIAANIRGIAITNFELSHYRVKEQTMKYDEIIVLINAYRNQLYIQRFDKNEVASKPELIDVDKIVEQLRETSHQINLAGNGLPVIYADIHTQKNLRILPRFAKIRAIHLCRFADDKIKAGRLDPIKPLYIRPPDAKVQKSS